MMEGSFEMLKKSLKAEVAARRLGAEDSSRVVSATTKTTRTPVASASSPSQAARVAATFPERKNLSPRAARVLGLPPDQRVPQPETRKPAVPGGYRIRVGDREFTEEQVRQVCHQALEAGRLTGNDATRTEAALNRRGQLPKDLLAKLYAQK